VVVLSQFRIPPVPRGTTSTGSASGACGKVWTRLGMKLTSEMACAAHYTSFRETLFTEKPERAAASDRTLYVVGSTRDSSRVGRRVAPIKRERRRTSTTPIPSTDCHGWRWGRSDGFLARPVPPTGHEANTKQKKIIPQQPASHPHRSSGAGKGFSEFRRTSPKLGASMTRCDEWRARGEAG
jgi:hypothetical protein